MACSSVSSQPATMSFLDTLRQWDEGANYADREDLSEALRIFLSIQEPNSKIYFNIGCLHLLNQDLDAAEKVMGMQARTLQIYVCGITTEEKVKPRLDVDDKEDCYIFTMKVQVTEKGEAELDYFPFCVQEVTVFHYVSQAFDSSIRKDEHLAVAFFQRAITFYKMTRQETPTTSTNWPHSCIFHINTS